MKCSELTEDEHKVLKQLVGMEKRGRVRLPLDSTALAAQLDMTAHYWTELMNDLDSMAALTGSYSEIYIHVRCNCGTKDDSRAPRPMEEPYRARDRRSGESEPAALARYFRDKGLPIMFGKTAELMNIGAFTKNVSTMLKQGVTYDIQIQMIDSFFEAIKLGGIVCEPSKAVWRVYLANKKLLFSRVGFIMPTVAEPARTRASDSGAREYLASRGLG